MTDQHTIALMPSGRRGAAPHGTTLLEAARALGVEIESICGGRQTCGKCQIIVEEGHFPKHNITSAADHLTPMGAVEADYCAEHSITGRRLACACEVVGGLLVNVPEESQARKQIIAKAATDRVIEIAPAVRQVYVEVEVPTMESHSGDWERLQTALADQWNLKNLTIDSVVLPTLQPALKQGKHNVTVTLWQDREVLRVEPGYKEGAYGLAVDVGSTTVVAHLCDLRTGVVLATEATMNPQVRYGEDLMSRVSYCMMEPQGVARLHRAIIVALNDLASKAATKAGLTTDDIVDCVLVGNPVMHHLLLNIDPVELGGAPFALAVSDSVDLKARDLGLKFHPAARVHVLPCIAGFVGADNVAVQLAEAPHQQDGLMLIIDVGTNAEIVLGNREQVLCASSPTGPAFEGAQITHGQRAAPGAVERVRIDPATLEPRWKVIGYGEWIGPGDSIPDSARATGICGSGIIEVIAEMFVSGIIDADGRFSDNGSARSPRARFNGRAGEYVLVDESQTATGKPIVVAQNDVRAIQLAKGALYAGTKLLMHHRGVTTVDKIVLAGAFGSYIDPKYAMILGLIPDCELEKVVAVGNAAGDGARIALLNKGQRLEASRLARWVQHVQTATDANFQTEFVNAMAMPHATDPFPHLEGMIPARAAAGTTGRRSQRRRAVTAPTT
ncbi:MAG: ASKHA domain-containing protein [Chloroflexota bacterium]